MKFPTFDMERMQSVWEHKVKYDLSESGVEPLTLEEAARDPRELLKTKLGYAEGVGIESTRQYISEFHWKSTADGVVITTGTSEANFLAMLALVNAGDEVVVVMPNYMQVHGIAQGLGAERDGIESPSFAGRGDRVIVTGGLSKAYGLPGLRIGWVVAPPEQAQAVLRLKDYTTIAPASVSEVLADIALERRPELLKRTRFLINERWPALEDWAATHARELHWTPPAAGAICFFSYRFPIDSMPLVDRLIRDYSTMVVPGIHFKAERHLRIGFGGPPRLLHSGLAALDRLLASLGD